jgi:ATP-dependent DNA helicase RecG
MLTGYEDYDMENQILKVKERVEIALETGESHFREFKSAIEGNDNDKKPRSVKEICKNIAKTLVGFANADGGGRKGVRRKGVRRKGVRKGVTH